MLGAIDRSDYTTEGDSEMPERRAKLESLMQAGNVADRLKDDHLGEIGQKVRREYDLDKDSRKEAGWDDRQKAAMDLAQQVKQAKSFPWPNAANVKYPLLTVAAIQFAARAYPAMVQGRDVVKAKVVGDDDGMPRIDPQTGQPMMQPGPVGEDGQPQPVPVWQIKPGTKRDRAARISRHMSWQITEQMEEWEEEFDRLLHVLPIVGCGFRKVRWDNRLGRPISEMVTAERFVANYWAKSLTTCPRYTHDFDLYPYQIDQRMRAGFYREVDLGLPEDANGDDQAEHLFLEQYTWLDLDGDGYDEPWIVTVHHDTQNVVRIVPRFDEDGMVYGENGKLERIEPTEYFVKFGFIPAADGSFYDIGFGHLLEPINEAINTTINQLLDAGTLSNAGGGWIGRGARVKSGVHRFLPGEWRPVESVGGVLKDQIVPLPVREPSAVLFSLLGALIDAGRDVANIKDVLLGDAQTQQTATTTMALIEQGMKVFGALYKRLHRSCGREFKILFRLNRLYLPDEQYFNVLDDPEAVKRADYNEKDLDVVPVSDPSMVTDMQRMAKAQFLMELLPMGTVDPGETTRRILEAAQIEGAESLVPQQQPPSPEAMKAQAEAKQMALDAKIKETELSIKHDELGVKRSVANADIALKTAQTRKTEMEAALLPVKQQADEAVAAADIEATGRELELKDAELARKTIETGIKAQSDRDKTAVAREGLKAKARTDA